MNNSIQSSGLLYKTIKWLCMDRGFHICIHDTSGAIHSMPELQLPIDYMIHNCSFCDCAKTSAAGIRTCLKCKSFCISKALRTKDTFTGQCYLGISEIVKPVFYNERLICMIFIGNLLIESQKPQVTQQIKRICAKTGVASSLLLDALRSTKPIEPGMLDEYLEIAQILHDYIFLVLNGNARVKSKASSPSPIYTSTDHWIIESVQNYVSTYYNRDLKLSHLAKLYFLNPQYLCRLFKNKTGTNFSDYINNIRIENAKRMLAFTKDDIIDVSIKVGFNNVTYFNRVFKKHTGITPGEYRKLGAR